jgi:hypothetical protein
MNFLSLVKKEKGKLWTVMGSNQPMSAHQRGNARAPAPALVTLLRGPCQFEQPEIGHNTIHVSLWHLRKTPSPFCFFTESGPWWNRVEHHAGAAILWWWRPEKETISTRMSCASLPGQKPSPNLKDLTLIVACSQSRRRKGSGKRVLGN